MRFNILLVIFLLFVSCQSNRNVELQGIWFSSTIDDNGKRTSTTPSIFHFENDSIFSLSLTHFDRDQQKGIFKFDGKKLILKGDESLSLELIFHQDSFQLIQPNDSKKRTFTKLKSGQNISPILVGNSYHIDSFNPPLEIKFLNDSLFVNLVNGKRDYWKKTFYEGFTIISLGQIFPLSGWLVNSNNDDIIWMNGYSNRSMKWKFIEEDFIDEDTCVFNNDIKGLTMDWAINLGLENFYWDQKSKQLVASNLDKYGGYDSLTLQKGGCLHSNQSVRLISGPAIKDLNDTSFWKSRILKMTNDFGFTKMNKLLEGSNYEWDLQRDKLLISILDPDEITNLVFDDIVIMKKGLNVTITISQYYN